MGKFWEPITPVVISGTPGSTRKLALTTGSQTISMVTWGLYRLWPDVDCFIKVGAGTVTAGTTGMPITAGDKEYILARDAKTHIAVILSVGTGNAYLTDIMGL